VSRFPTNNLDVIIIFPFIEGNACCLFSAPFALISDSPTPCYVLICNEIGAHFIFAHILHLCTIFILLQTMANVTKTAIAVQ
jgi:hypothetical protein